MSVNARQTVRMTLLATLLAALVSLASLAEVAGQDASAPSPAEQQALKDSVSRYAARRGDGPVIARSAVSERLLAQQPVVVLDVREAGKYAEWHVEGARSLPLSQLMASGGQVADLPRDGQLVVVHDDPLAAVEAAVVLRLAGYSAVAMNERLGMLAQDLTQKPEGERLLTGQEAAREAAAEAERLAPGADPNQRTLMIALAALAAVGLAVGVGVLLYFQVWQPRRRRRPLMEALAIIQEDRRAEFGRAEELLEHALTLGMKDGDIAEARFGLAYVRARLGNHAEAGAAIEELVKSGDASTETLYLSLWLLVQQKQYAQAVQRFERYADRLDGVLQSRLLFAIALLEQGRISLARRQTGEALGLFRRLRALGELADKIPSEIDDQDVAVGIDAMFQDHIAEAEGHFATAISVAEKAGRSTLHARLGVLLCRWRQETHPDIDAELGALIDGAAAELGLDRLANGTAPATADTTDAAAQPVPIGVEAGETIPTSGDDADEDLSLHLLPVRGSQAPLDAPLLRGVLLWHAVSLLHTWMKLPAGGGLPAGQMDRLTERLGRVRLADPRMQDPLLIEGLLRYHLATNSTERSEAVAMLNEATGVTVPELTLLLARERKLTHEAANSQTTYLGAARAYVRDEQVPIEMRDELRAFIAARGVDLGDSALDEGAGTTGPLAEFEARLRMSRDRLELITQRGLVGVEVGTKERLAASIADLNTASTTLATTVSETQRLLHQVMMLTAETLLPEEQTPAADPDAPAQPDAQLEQYPSPNSYGEPGAYGEPGGHSYGQAGAYGEPSGYRQPGQPGPDGHSPEVPGGRVDLVHFSVTTPPLVEVGRSFLLDVWAHLDLQREQMIQRAREAVRGREIMVKSQGPNQISRGTLLTVRLLFDTLMVAEPDSTILWAGEIGNATFRVQVPPDTTKGSYFGWILVYASGFQIAKLTFEVEVGIDSTIEKVVKSTHYRSAFASYASEDADLVVGRIQGLLKAAPHLDIFWDRHSLRSGDYWEQELRRQIADRDVLYLFWSAHARDSQWVEQEWRYALTTRGLDFIDPVPLVAPHLVPPPDELAGRHFNDWILAYQSSPSLPAGTTEATTDPVTDVPPEYRSGVRRTQRLLTQVTDLRLTQAYDAFLRALNAGQAQDDLDDLYDALEEAYLDARTRLS